MKSITGSPIPTLTLGTGCSTSHRWGRRSNMNHSLRITIASCSFLLLANFSAQDTTTSGGLKPAVNFYGTVTDTSDKTFKALNITLERMYKQIPAYQIAPKNATESYDPAINITRLDLSEISKIVFPENQKPQKYNNREYLVVKVYSRDNNKTENEYLAEADKKLICDEANDAGPIEKEIKFKAVREIVIEGYKQSDALDSDDQKKLGKRKASETPDQATSLKTQKPETHVKAAQASGSKRRRLLGYLKDMFGFKEIA